MNSDNGEMMVSQLERITKIIIRVLRKYDVKRAALFGSTARGEATKRSDIDLLVEFKGKKVSWTW